MPKEFRFPDVGEGIAEGELIRWLVKEGDTVAEHQPLVEIETDKAVVTLPTPYAGTVLKLQGKPGEIIPVGTVLSVIDESGAKPAAAAPSPRRDKGSVVGQLEEAPEEETRTAPEMKPPVPRPGSAPSTPPAMPAVRARAKELGVDLSRVKGTGPGGRVTMEDLDRAVGPAAAPAEAPAVTAAGPVEEIPLRGIRRASARHVAESASRVAAVSIFDDADVTQLEEVRQKERKVAEARGFKLTYLPFIIKATIAGLKEFPYLNASLDDARDVILLKKYFHMGIAIDTPDGLMVYVIQDADRKSILELAEQMHQLGEKAAQRKIELTELKGSTMTITNFGVIGGNYGTPIINYPEVAILGLGKITDRPVARNGQVVVRRILPLSLTFDHRVIHGAEAARFLNSVIGRLEDPDRMLIEGK
ncbi:MAG TPA: dihydrolipoamide acetyltransferase family protein [Nitrospiria bacterium]|jgi:pyruvate dehydrogenase E2 component (dihydrolipoamide acetyltransferase)|nr:dihydrolipoamide acetyltransferase family protein [Nitrospiria bacterium]